MKKDKMRGLDPAEMQNKLAEISEQQFRIRFQMSMGQTEGLKKAREIRRDKARLLTYLREKELAGAKTGGKK
ncbi:MAG TPA: 50S ribosomal protein L29 [Bryobacteraceae bacterium]|nr:50S ribosomal protein L29 [Bryobacteraceae bacterium]